MSMKKFIEEMEWIFDYYIVYFLYNPNKNERYSQFLQDKWEFLPEKPYKMKKIKLKEVKNSTMIVFPEFDSIEQPDRNTAFYS